MIYLDNASTTNYKPFSVRFYTNLALLKKYCANPGRSSHRLSTNAGNIVYKTRAELKKFFNADLTQNIVFTSGCTEALNMAIFGTLKKNGNIVYTSNEHNSVARPVEFLKQKGLISATMVKASEKGVIDPEEIEKAISSSTYLVIVNQTSNVTGATSNIREIGKICKNHNILFLVDAAQSAGHIRIDMKKDNISMLAVAGHKGLLSIQGIGVLLFRNDVTIDPIKFGGTGTFSESLTPPVSYPESLEAGTGPTPAIFSLYAGLKYVEKHFDKINSRIRKLTNYFLNELYLRRKKVKIYTDRDCLSGVISFSIKRIATSEAVEFFNERGVCVRGGLHCAPLCHRRLNTLDGGAIRVSFSSFNTKHEIKKFLKILDNLLSCVY